MAVVGAPAHGCTRGVAAVQGRHERGIHTAPRDVAAVQAAPHALLPLPLAQAALMQLMCSEGAVPIYNSGSPCSNSAHVDRMPGGPVAKCRARMWLDEGPKHCPAP